MGKIHVPICITINYKFFGIEIKLFDIILKTYILQAVLFFTFILLCKIKK